MRIVKSFPVTDEKSKVVSAIFDHALKSFYYPWRFDVMELHLRDENKVVVEGKRCIIVVNYKDSFVKTSDRGGISAIIIRSFFKATVKERFGEIPEMIEDIIANRQMIKSGYGGILMNYYFQRELVKKENDIPGSLEEDIGWLSFYGQDEYNSMLLRRKKQQHKETKKLVKCLKEDLEREEHLSHAIREYKEVMKGCRQ